MTLFSVDKNLHDRSQPTPNADDVHMNPKAHATDSISPRAEGTQGTAKVTTKNSQIIANNGSNNIGLFGFDDAGNMVVKVAKPGFDANNASNSNLVFNSSQNVFKIVNSGFLTIPSITVNTGGANYAAATPVSVSTPHSLGIVPIVIGFFNNSGTYLPLPWNTTGSVGGGGFATYTFWVASDATNIYGAASGYGFNKNDTQPSNVIKWFALQETAN